jgi:hypothetical protein
MGDRSISSIVAKNLVKSKILNYGYAARTEVGRGKKKGDNERDWKFSRNEKPETEVVFARN